MKPIPYRKIVLVIALGVIHGLNAIARISSLLFVASIDRYNVDREKASFPYALRIVIEPLAGPFIGYLACKIGFRPVVVLGGLISSMSFAACFFVEDILMLSVLYGGIFAIGISMARELIPSVIFLNFDKDIALINGLTLIGASIGGLLLPPLFDVTFNAYGLSGTFLFMGGLLLHSVPAGMLLWPPKSAESKLDAPNSKIICDDDAPAKCSSEQVETSSLSSVTGDKRSKNLFITKDGNVKGKCENDEKVHDDGPVVESESSRAHIQSDFEPLQTSNEKETRSHEIKLLSHLPIEKQNPIQSEQESKRSKSTEVELNCDNKKRNIALETLSLFWDPLFLLLTISLSLFRTIYMLFVIIFMDYAIDIDIPRYQAIYLVMCLSASDIIGRVSLAWITDRGYMGIVNFTALSYVVVAASLAVMCFWKEFAVVFAATFVFGLGAAAVSIVVPGLVSKYFKGNKKTTAMASRFFLSGPMSLAISPLIGVFRTGHGSYRGLMYLIIGSLLFCAISQLFLPVIARHSKKKTVKNTSDNTSDRLI